MILTLTNNIDKCCMNCVYAQIENAHFDTTCELTHKVCRIDIDKDIYTVCDKWIEDKWR